MALPLPHILTGSIRDFTTVRYKSTFYLLMRCHSLAVGWSPYKVHSGFFPTKISDYLERDMSDMLGWRGGLVVGRRTCDLKSRVRAPAATLLSNNLRQVVHTLLPLSPSSIIWYQRKLGSKQAYRMVHRPVSRGLAVFADAWLSGWLAEISADLQETVAH